MTEATRGEEVEPDHLDVIPPSAAIGLALGVPQLGPRARGRGPHPPDRPPLPLLAEGGLARDAAPLGGDAEEVLALYHDPLIDVTSISRDPKAFEAMERVVSPEILGGRDPGTPIRARVAGCSTARRACSAVLGHEIPCYVLEGDVRVIGRTPATEALTGIKGGGGFEKYLSVGAFKQFIDIDRVLGSLVPFCLPEVEGLETQVKGISTDLMIEIWRGFVAALEASNRPASGISLTPRQREMALKASMLLAACAKVGLDALVDEATGSQGDRARDALEVKLRACLEQEMRKREKTFPDALWAQLARLTKWKGSVTQRPKYWGKLVMEFIYE